MVSFAPSYLSFPHQYKVALVLTCIVALRSPEVELHRIQLGEYSQSMKFGHFYLERLQDFPVHLREPAVSYRQLKKYLKLVRKELESCGLDRLTVLRLASHASQAERVGASDATEQEESTDVANEEPELQYTLVGMYFYTGEPISKDDVLELTSNFR